MTLVNVTGSFAFAAIAAATPLRFLPPGFEKILLVGLLGGFTTFSTFGYETFAMLRDGDYTRALGNVGLHVVLGLVFVWLGYTLSTAR